MNFQSNRDARHLATASEAIQRGLAPDGGLYVPQTLPRVSLEIAGPPAEVAQDILRPFFARDPLAGSLSEIAREALNLPASIVPLEGAPSEVDVLELFHGPTLAFKDFGARFLAGALARLRASSPRPLTILLATSGDTGGAVPPRSIANPG